MTSERKPNRKENDTSLQTNQLIQIKASVLRCENELYCDRAKIYLDMNFWSRLPSPMGNMFLFC